MRDFREVGLRVRPDPETRQTEYGVPYMSATADEHFEITLRGFSPRELRATAERECRKHFGECAWRIEEQTCMPCMGSLGGHVRLFETRVIASPDTE
jgi:hypothetical protein